MGEERSRYAVSENHAAAAAGDPFNTVVHVWQQPNNHHLHHHLSPTYGTSHMSNKLGLGAINGNCLTDEHMAKQ